MILKSEKMPIVKGYESTTSVSSVSRDYIDKLNNRIIDEIRQNEINREKGLEIAARCRMK